MALAACAYAKTARRQRIMACTSSIGLVQTKHDYGSGFGHRPIGLPVLFLPGDVFATRTQILLFTASWAFNDPTMSVEWLFSSRLSRYFWSLINRQSSWSQWPAAINTMLDPNYFGPSDLSIATKMCKPWRLISQQASSPESSLNCVVKSKPIVDQLGSGVDAIKKAKSHWFCFGGGVPFYQLWR